MNRPLIELYTSGEYNRDSRNGIAEDEGTVSNVFRHIPGQRNMALRSGKSYAKTVLEQFLDRDLVRDQAVVLEIGGGEGHFADDFLSYARYRRTPIARYVMLDLNTHLLAMQKDATSRHSRNVDLDFVLADASDIPLAPGSIDIAILNEVIGDFPVIKNLPAKVVRSYPEVPSGFEASEVELLARAAELIKDYDLEMPKIAYFHLNYGAIQALFALDALLSPGGSAFITEHSCEVERTDYWDQIPGFFMPEEEWGFPDEIELPGHSEFNIKFSHLEAVARALGFEVENGLLHEFIGLMPYNFLERHDYLFTENVLQFRYLLLTKPQSSPQEIN